MATDLEIFIQSAPLVDTHEHLLREPGWADDGPQDVLQDLFFNYVPADLISAGASPEAVRRLADPSDPDLEGRFRGVEKAWRAIRHTGYGEAVRTIASTFYGLEELVPEKLAQASRRTMELREPGNRLRLLRDVVGLDHIQTDDFCWPCPPDESGPDFFLYDLSWWTFCSGRPDLEQLADATGVTVNSVQSLDTAMESLFERWGPTAIAVKAQHAYNRSLAWIPRSRGEAERALQDYLHDPQGRSEESRFCLGDWCWAKGAELAGRHDLPFKLHTGYYAGNWHMVMDRIHASHLAELFRQYPGTRFVLMHIAHPYSDELTAMVKHFPNAYADLCWAWSINPRAAGLFVRRFLHEAPINKLFAFGGDTRWPTSAAAYALQCRHWLSRALLAEVEEGYLSESEARSVASDVMRNNQYDCFRLDACRSAIAAASA